MIFKKTKQKKYISFPKYTAQIYCLLYINIIFHLVFRMKLWNIYKKAWWVSPDNRQLSRISPGLYESSSCS